VVVELRGFRRERALRSLPLRGASGLLRARSFFELESSPVYDLSDFTPRDYFGAHYVEMDFTEGYGEIVKDFLR